MRLTVFALIAGLTIATAAAADAPKNPCSRPVVPNKMASETSLKSFNRRMDTYKKCINEFAAERREFADHTTDKAAAAEAYKVAEAAILEFNELAKELNDRNAGDQE